MKVQIKAASVEQKPILEQLVQLYLYDFSEIEGFDMGRDGLFETTLLDSYWVESDRYPFLIYANDRIVGFVLVNSYTCLEENKGAGSVAEFFIMRRYRRQGIGTTAAHRVFEMFPGKWEVRQIQANEAGQLFWRNVIGEYTRGNFTETTLDNDLWRGPIQSFTSGRK